MTDPTAKPKFDFGGVPMFTKIEIKGDFLHLTASSNGVFVEELKRFLKMYESTTPLEMRVDYCEVSLKLGDKTLLSASQRHCEEGQWDIDVPLDDIIHRRVPERYSFLTPREWREANWSAIQAALEARNKARAESPSP